MNLRGLGLFVVAVLVGFSSTVPAQDYVFNRTQQLLNATSRSTVRVQGVTEQTNNPQVGPDGYVLSSATETHSQAVPGGGGGGGGDGALAINGSSGAPGGMGVPFDGLDGDDAGGTGGAGGKGGKKGGDGTAEGIAIATGSGEVNPNQQSVLSWTFLHSHDIDADLLASAGGGGGGGGGGGWTLGGGFPPLPPLPVAGYNGGSGGMGRPAEGVVTSREETEANVVATMQFGPGADENTPNTAVGWIEVDLAWGGSGVGTIQSAWQRGVNVTVTMGGSNLVITGGPNGVVNANGTFPDGGAFFKQSFDQLNSTTGSFSIGPGEFASAVNVGQAVTINTGGVNRNFSQVQAQGTANPGFGGGGGSGGADQNGANGQDQPQGTQGGQGGAGGAGNNLGNGGRGGHGGYGQQRTALSVGMFEGLIAVFVD